MKSIYDKHRERITSLDPAVKEKVNSIARKAFMGESVFTRIAAEVVADPHRVDENGNPEFNEYTWHTPHGPKTVYMKEYGDYLATTCEITDEKMERAAHSTGLVACDKAELIARNELDKTEPIICGSADTIGELDSVNGTIQVADILFEVSEMDDGNVKPYDKRGNYLCIIHPRVFSDLAGQIDSAEWRGRGDYVPDGGHLPGETGMYCDVRFILSQNCHIEPRAGVNETDVYTTYILGNDALWFVHVGEFPDIEITSIVDEEDGKQNVVSWYGLLAFTRLNEHACVTLKTAASDELSKKNM